MENRQKPASLGAVKIKTLLLLGLVLLLSGASDPVGAVPVPLQHCWLQLSEHWVSHSTAESGGVARGGLLTAGLVVE